MSTSTGLEYSVLLVLGDSAIRRTYTQRLGHIRRNMLRQLSETRVPVSVSGSVVLTVSNTKTRNNAFDARAVKTSPGK